ncbi:TPA: hypothetical protein JBF89_15385 [Legionella pneumophila]|nr:hypothetical protein [Legionella pneumophila]HAU0352115.1 hypothetical protein [Legionella pneumophila]HAU0355291.1 hypothetical protein [Legionella pneumophila]HAU0361460.1 hypothetical protein [Legionella pneumophila]HAU0370235.1 hypothetical protein [Legionella pneumophila]
MTLNFLSAIFSVISTLAIFFLGMLADSAQEYFKYKLHGDREKADKKRDAIRKAYLLTQNIKKLPQQVSHTLLITYLVENEIKAPVPGEQYLNIEQKIDELKLILEYDAPCSEELKSNLKNLTDKVHIAMLIASTKFTAPLMAIPKDLQEIIQLYGSGDPTVATKNIYNQTLKDSDNLIRAIEAHLKDQFTELENSAIDIKTDGLLRYPINKLLTIKNWFSKLCKRVSQE